MYSFLRIGYYDIVTDIISPRDQSKPGSKSKKKRKREVPTTTTDSSKNRKISLSELEAEKQLLMKAALQSRLYSSTDKVVRLFTLHKRKCETLFGLMLLCKETIQSLSPNTRVKSMKFTKYESICDILISDHYRPIFPEPTLSTNQSKIPLPELLPSHTLKSFSSRKLGLKRNETITSISPEHNLKGNGFREISSTTISEPNQRLEQRDTQHSTQLTTVTTKPFEVVGSFAKRVTGPLLNADYFIVVVCLRNSSR